MKQFALLFDMDGVVVDSNPFHKKVLKEFISSKGKDIDEAELKANVYGRTNRDWLTRVFGEMSEKQLTQYTEEKEQLFRDAYEGEVVALAGLESLLKEAKEAGVPVVMGTSAPAANVSFVLQHTGLGRYFGTILTDADVSTGKPAPEIYQKAAKAAGIAPENCIVFEDSVSGVKAGRAANCKVVGIITTHTEAELSPVVLAAADFTDINLSNLAALMQ